MQLPRRQVAGESLRPQVGQGDRHRLLHDVTELAREDQARVALHGRGLDEQHVTTGTGHREARGDTRHRRPLRRLRREPRPTEELDQRVGVDVHRRRRARVERDRHLAQDLREAPLQLPHARLPGVLGGDHAQRDVGELDVRGLQAGLLDLPGQQVVAGDGDLLRLGVAVERHPLHPVGQRAGDGLADVRGGEEQHVAQVEVDLEVVVAERVVLRRVEDLQQRRGRVAAVVAAHLVDLVEQHDRVHRAGLADRADDAAGQCADVGAPVAADLGLVAHPAEGDADELAAQRPGDRLAKRRLADTGRPDQGHHGAGPTATDLLQPAAVAPRADGQELDQPFLDVVQPRVVRVQHRAGGDEVVAVVGADVPRDVEDGVQPGADPPGLGVLLRAALELVDLLERGLVHVLRQVRGLDAGPVVVSAASALRTLFAELLADRGELLAQQELPLLALDALADVLADLLRDLLLGDVLLGPLDQQLEAALHVGLGEQLRLLRVVEVRRPTGQVGQCTGVRGALDVVDHLPRAALLQDRHDQRLVLLGELEHPPGRRRVGDRLDLHPQGRSGPRDAGPDPGPDLAAHDRGLLTTGQPTDLLEDGHGADGGVASVETRNDEDLAIDARIRLTLCRIDSRRDLRLVEPDGNHHAGQQHRVGERKHRQLQRLCHNQSNAYTVVGIPAFNQVRSG